MSDDTHSIPEDVEQMIRDADAEQLRAELRGMIHVNNTQAANAAALRKQTRELRAEVERLQAKIADDALTIGAQKDTIARLCADKDDALEARLRAEIRDAKYEASHQHLRAREITAQLMAERKRLAWFEAQDPLVRRLRDTLHNVVASEWSKEAANDECAFFDDWMSENPKPEGGAKLADSVEVSFSATNAWAAPLDRFIPRIEYGSNAAEIEANTAPHKEGSVTESQGKSPKTTE